MQASKLREILYCIRCGSCLNACPVYREIGGHAYVSKDGKGSPYPGPVGSVVSPAMFGQCEYGQLARASSLCGACRDACPVDIDLPRLLLRVRTGIQAGARQKQVKPNAPLALAAGLKLFTLAASHPGRFTAIQMLGDFLGTLATWFSKGDRWVRLPKFTGWGYSKDFPLPMGKPFRMRFVNQESQIHPINNHLATARESKTDNDSTEKDSTNKKNKGMAGFAHELQALGGYFQSCSVDQVAEKVLEILRQHGMDQILVWDANELPAGLLDLLSEKRINLIHPTGDSIHGSNQVQAGLSGASAGIADTGSLLLLGGNGKPLIASLLPEIHIAILWEKDICEELDTVLSEDMVKESSVAVLIAGPSRTADIEMTLTIGVHGPGELHVLCISNEE
jgi:L-lactate utilization protein LutB